MSAFADPSRGRRGSRRDAQSWSGDPGRRGGRGRGRRKSSGCGCLGFTTLAVLVIIGLVGAMAVFTGPVEAPFSKQPIPDDVPPAAAEPAPRIDVHAGGRTSDQLAQWAEPIAEATRIPAAALRAYGNAEVIAAEQYPGCHLTWNTLAGLGFVETRHGSYSGNWLKPAEIGPDGVVRPPIVGVPLDGSPGFAEIRDTDGGELDGDPVYDRAVGPMQFIPGTWAAHGVDANGDGVADPQNIDDAAASAALLLCSGGRDLSDPEDWTAAIRSYNQSGQYVVDVRDAAANYALHQSA